MTKEKFALHGSCVALPTPFRFGTVDFRALEELCHRQVDRGTAALVPCGTTGEAPLLTPDEHHRVIAATVAAAAGRVPVIAGAGNNTRALGRARSLRRAGGSPGAALRCALPSQADTGRPGRPLHGDPRRRPHSRDDLTAQWTLSVRGVALPDHDHWTARIPARS